MPKATELAQARDKIKRKRINRYKEGNYIMMKKATHQEAIIIMHLYEPTTEQEKRL